MICLRKIRAVGKPSNYGWQQNAHGSSRVSLATALLTVLVGAIAVNPGTILAQSDPVAHQLNLMLENQIPIQTRAGTTGDSDNDGVSDIIDLDDDNDTIPDDIEGEGDTDGDGIADCLDVDSDNDGITDLLEVAAGSGLINLLDANRDGRLDATVAVGGNGLADVVELSAESGTSVTGNADLDGDGVRDQQDLDTDNDGIPDVIEAGSSDTNFDGRYDLFRDVNGDGLADRLSVSPILARDTDRDGIEDFRDLDSDQDGLSDLLETTGIDTDGDGHVDDFVDLNFDGLDDGYNTSFRGLPDTDRDGLPDHRDTDSDGDGIADSEEAFDGTALINPAFPNSPFIPGPFEQQGEIILKTGQSGSVFGCTLSSSTNRRQPIDPLLLFIFFAAAVCLFQKRVKIKKSNLLAIGLASVVLLSGCVTPLNSNPAGRSNSVQPYVGIGFGVSVLDANTDGLALEQDENVSAAGQLTLGIAKGNALALELRAADLGEATFTSGDAVGYQVVDLSGLYRMTSSRLTGFGRVGVGALFNDGDIPTSQTNKTHLLVGVGVEYAVKSTVAIRAEWQGHDVDVMHSQLSILYRFGRSPPSLDVASTAQSETNDRQVNDDNVVVSPVIETTKPSTQSMVDIDQDGIDDATDKCAETVTQTQVFADGCAMFGDPVSGLTFFPDSDRLTNSAKSVLDKVADALVEKPFVSVTVAVHTSASTDPNAAMFLTRRRTIAIIRYLSSRGIDATRLRPEAYGDTQPLATATVPSDNERVVLSLR